jgi:hypothetical protein
LLKYTRSADEIIKVINEEIYEKNFYYKRVYLVFFENVINKFSISYINEMGILDKIIQLFNSNIFLSNKLITLLPCYFAPLPDDKKKVILDKVKYFSAELSSNRLKDTELKKVVIYLNRT